MHMYIVCMQHTWLRAKILQNATYACKLNSPGSNFILWSVNNNRAANYHITGRDILAFFSSYKRPPPPFVVVLFVQVGTCRYTYVITFFMLVKFFRETVMEKLKSRGSIRTTTSTVGWEICGWKIPLHARCTFIQPYFFLCALSAVVARIDSSRC